MLTNSLKISNTTKKNFSSWFSSKVIKKDDKNYCHADWSAASDLLTCSLSISVLTWGFLGVSVTPLFAIYNFRNKWLLRIILFPKVFKVLWGFWKWRKKLENLFSFEDNCIWIGCVKHSLLLREREYLSSVVNMLRNSLKISDTTKTKFFELIFFQSHQKIWQNYCCAALTSV